MAGTACTLSTDHDATPLEFRANPGPVVTHATVGAGITCATTEDGELQCWGRNERGQLGHGNLETIGDDEFPADADPIALSGPVVEIRTNGAQTFARLADGTIHAWGQNDAAQLGLLHTMDLGDDETPATASEPTAVDLGGVATALAVGASFACALRADAAVLCWGAGNHGQLGLGNIARVGDDETPQGAGTLLLGAPVVGLTAGADHACALLDSGQIRCWGANDYGQLGLGHTDPIGDDETPDQVAPVALGQDAVEVVAGGHHTCARLNSGAIRCWGQGTQGALGLGTTDHVGDDEHPHEVDAVPVGVTVGGTVVELGAGAAHTCARLDTGAVRCWGANTKGQLGYGHTQTLGAGQPLADDGDLDLGGTLAIALVTGPTADHTCVRTSDDALRCWGDNNHGQLGLAHVELFGDDPNEAPGDLPNIVVLMDDEI
ncbi:MAG: hypothetical protein AAGF11_56440 [Myxococcota bacterium]